jgi:hypothetical protein
MGALTAGRRGAVGLLGATVVLAACLLAVPRADAAIVSFGSPLTAAFAPGVPATEEGTVANLALGEPGASATAPVSGTIVSWHLLDSSGGPYRLRVLREVDPLTETFRSVGTSAPETSTGLGLQTFPTALPVAAGDLIALTVGVGVPGAVATAPAGAVFGAWTGSFAEGAERKTGAAVPEVEVAYNAQVLPPPTITSVGTLSGQPSGGTGVTVAGTDFAEVQGVSFGAAPAAAYTVDSEGQITAVAPAGAAGTAVPISITTLAGTATSSQQFTYQASTTANPTQSPAPVVPASTCTVPNLKGKTLKASKTKIRGAHCKVGKVTKRKGVRIGTGKVVGQNRKPGTVLPAGSVVKVTLGKG